MLPASVEVVASKPVVAPVEYREIAGFIGYRVGDDGSVWSRYSRGRNQKLTDVWLRLKPTPQSRGHLGICLTRNGKKHYGFVHRIVLEAFVGPCPEGMECRHLDGNPGNNRKDNLCWGTYKENGEDRIRHGTSGKGEASCQAKLTEDDVRKILVLKEAGFTQREIADSFLITLANVQAILYGHSWNHVTGIARPAYLTRPKGERQKKRRLTEEEALAILAKKRAGVRTGAIVAEFKVSWATVRNIELGYTWAHLPREGIASDNHGAQ